jgi:hypothetical protein
VVLRRSHQGGGVKEVMRKSRRKKKGNVINYSTFWWQDLHTDWRICKKVTKTRRL